MDEFLVELADLLEVEKSELTSGYPLEENENWDSLAFISVLVMIDEHFQLTISNDALRKCSVVGDLLKLIIDKQQLIGS
ncbi:acyl carrier protein [Neobacillus drentensis]|uniref:acyl carrier protein n=1 Tax=Neobacillus drentensis TaxID=220684 RepID=UPI002FFEFBA9